MQRASRAVQREPINGLAVATKERDPVRENKRPCENTGSGDQASDTGDV